MTKEEQIAQWAAGNSVHNHITDYCVPDYSCCYPELAVDLDQRKAYRLGNAHLRAAMQRAFIHALIKLRLPGYGRRFLKDAGLYKE